MAKSKTLKAPIKAVNNDVKMNYGLLRFDADSTIKIALNKSQLTISGVVTSDMDNTKYNFTAELVEEE